ncbi:hypothetical protein BGP77_15380 [Saccharospirillum sp. MSK14-1]|uniref:GNAT family N-acetyltransferase n=1 Tax=Saccharospirillum sp. MSK14-1 TaxID=1897632 RepID=UPI000D35D6F4|nr:GNAT family N-acetyltransferase [Saccharospirillum sp. MSK14-1]PTY37852.1 hypothetical protein BGP77_15380 [Saccharospirillum sp. MSK14-1]
MPTTQMLSIQPFQNSHRTRCFDIFAELDGWFGSEELNNEYAEQLCEANSLVGLIDNNVEGVISLLYHYDTTAEIYSMAVSLAHHHQGIGTQLLTAAEALAKRRHCSFLHVKTLGDTLPHPGYQNTRAFYESYGFRKLFQTEDLWNGLPTMLYVKTVT